MIRASGLVKHYKEKVALDGVDLSVNAGEIIGLLGANGAGKTTTLRILAGILSPTSGEVEICGKALDVNSFEAKKELGFLSAETQLYKRLTPREVLRFFGQLHEMEESRLERRIEDLVEELQIKEYADQQIGGLSTGQKQRVSIARTILHDPPVFILDEVTASLDLLSSRFVMDYLLEARDKGKAIIFSTHIMSEAEVLCDSIAMIHKGKIVDRGTKQELLDRSKSDSLTACFLRKVREIEEMELGAG